MAINPEKLSQTIRYRSGPVMIMNTFPAVEYAPRCFLGAMSVSSSGALGRFRHTRVNRERIKWVELRAILCQNSHG